jgi:dipeptide/tripeptide permease
MDQLRQPKQLYLLFFAEMWERFSFYGMRALLLVYMVSQLHYDDPKAYAILGSYAALVYTMPMFGGFIADRFIGYQRAIIFGGVLILFLQYLTTGVFFMEWLLLFVAMVFSNPMFPASLELYIKKMIPGETVVFLFFIWALILVQLQADFYALM